MSEWQSPETAKRGKRVLIKYWIEGHRMLCTRGDGCKYEPFREERVAIAKRRHETTDFSLDAYSHNGEIVTVQPHGWMPLPETNKENLNV